MLTAGIVKVGITLTLVNTRGLKKVLVPRSSMCTRIEKMETMLYTDAARLQSHDILSRVRLYLKH